MSFLMIIGIVALFVWLITGNKNFMKNQRVVKFLLLIYSAVLLLSIFIFEMLPFEWIEMTNATEQQLLEEQMDIVDAIEDGRTDQIDPAYVQNTWEFAYKGEQLQIHQKENGYDYPIVIERKDENDGLIEGTFFASIFFDGNDITDEMQDFLDLSLNGDTLSINSLAEETVYKMTVYKKEFVINQFSKEASEQSIWNSHLGEMQYLYLRVPKDIEIIKEEDLFIHYVGE